MRTIHIRRNFLAGYLIILAIYGFVNMLFCFKYGYESPETRSIFLEKIKSPSRIIKNRNQPISSVEDFFDRLAIPETKCSKMVEVGGSSCKKSMDHSKMICLDEDVKIISKRCTVYSFGIGEDMTFDDLMERFGCEVYTFDHTVPFSMVKDNLRKNLQFFHIGLSDKFEKSHHKWTWQDGETAYVRGHVDTLHNIKKKLGHQNKTINYLKIDIEGSEWQAIPEIIKSGDINGISQIAVEIHAVMIKHLPEDKILRLLQDLWNILLDLRSHGFLRTYYQINPVLENLFHIPGTNKSIHTCGELLLIKRNHNPVDT